MGFSTRELYLVLRARDEASRTLRGVSRELLATGSAAAQANARQAAAMERQRAAQARAAAAQIRMYAATQRQAGATKQQIQQLENSARAYDMQARNASTAARKLDAEADAARRAAVNHEHLVNMVHQSGIALATLGVGLVAGGAIGLAALASTIRVTQEYERQVALTKTQVDGFQVSLKKLGDMGLQVANTIGVSFEQIQPELYDIFSSTNANVHQSEILLKAFAKASVAGQVDMQAATRTTLSIMNAYHIPLEKVNDVLDVQFQLVRKGVGTYSQFASVIGNAIPAATRAGQSFETVAGMLAYMTRNGLSAAMASTSAARSMEAMSNPKTVDRLKKLGINFYDATGKARPLADVLTELRDKLMKLPAPDRIRALTDLLKGSGGTIQARRFLDQVLLKPGELENFIAMVDSMKNSSGEFEKAYAGMSDTVAAKTQLLKNRFKILQEQTGKALVPAFLAVVDAISKLLAWFNALPEGTRDSIVKILAVAAALSVVSGIALIVIGGLAALIAAVAAAGTALAVVAGVAIIVVGGIAALGAAFLTAWQNADQFRALMSTLWGIIQQAATIIQDFGSKLKSAWDRKMSEPLEHLWNVIVTQVLPALQSWWSFLASTFIPKIREAGRLIGDGLSTIIGVLASVINTYLVPALQYMVTWWDENRKYIEPLFPIFAQVMKWAIIIAAILVGVLAAAILGPVLAAIAALIVIVIAVMKAFSMLKDGVNAVIGVFKSAIGWANSFGTTLANAAQRAWDWFKNLGSTIKGAIGNLGGLLVDAGRQILSGLIDGLKQKIGDVKGLLTNLTSSIAGWKGPRQRDLKLLIPAGGAIMTGLMTGIKNSVPLLKRTLGNVTSMIQAPDGPGNDFYTPKPPPTVPGSGGGGGTTKIYNITQNITTQEISPIRQAAALGWEVTTVT